MYQLGPLVTTHYSSQAKFAHHLLIEALPVVHHVQHSAAAVPQPHPGPTASPPIGWLRLHPGTIAPLWRLSLERSDDNPACGLIPPSSRSRNQALLLPPTPPVRPRPIERGHDVDGPVLLLPELHQLHRKPAVGLPAQVKVIPPATGQLPARRKGAAVGSNLKERGRAAVGDELEGGGQEGPKAGRRGGGGRGQSFCGYQSEAG